MRIFERWLLRDKITISIGWYPQWDMKALPFLEARTNGWRLGDRCLDATFRIHRLNLNAVFWSMPFQKRSNN